MTSKIGTCIRLCFRNKQIWSLNGTQTVQQRISLPVWSNQICTSPQKRLYTTTGNSTSTADAIDNEKPPPAKGVEDSETPEISAEAKALEELKASHEKLTEAKKAAEDKYMRALAETENVRQRMRKQVDDAKQFGIQGFCKDLLTVADTLRLASDNIPAEQLENSSVKSMFEGLKLTESQLAQVFKQHGVKLTNPEGEKFDPNVHEAVFQQPIPEKEPGTIFVVTKPGYTLNDRVLRPAMVGVVKAP